MKKLFLGLLMSVALVSFTSQADTSAVVAALQSANADKVASYFDTIIDLSLPGKDEIKNIGKNQATITLKSFFEENGVKGFELTNHRESGTTMYMAGKLQARSRPFNITILLKNKEGKHWITSIRIN
ncbi:MAG: DUF4783 domain-containing protein [Bacteroidota bacterium]|nr:DUF4783 domain-containing protein [Bacteroidota bacterium]